MSIRLGKYGKIYEKLMFKDLFDVLRVKVDKDGPFDNNTVREKVEELSDIPCRVSITKPDLSLMSNGMFNTTDRIVTLFAPIRYEVIEGDWIEATIVLEGRTQTVKGICNLPDVYETHQQIVVSEHEDA